MKFIGFILLVVGGLAFLFGFSMDTTVATGLGTLRVPNMGLINLQQNLFIFAGILTIIGVIFVDSSGKNKPPKKHSSQSADTRKCPFCAELVNAEAVICRFCQKDLQPIQKPARKDRYAAEPTSTTWPIAPGETLTEDQRRTMERFGITYDGDKFIFREYCYLKLSDAVDYAKFIARKA